MKNSIKTPEILLLRPILEAIVAQTIKVRLKVQHAIFDRFKREFKVKEA